MTDDDLRARLMREWIAWDRRPGHIEMAVAMQDACRAYEPEHTPAFRRHLAASRRAGIERGTAIDTWDPWP
jgi:hypothetical protein